MMVTCISGMTIGDGTDFHDCLWLTISTLQPPSLKYDRNLIEYSRSDYMRRQCTERLLAKGDHVGR